MERILYRITSAGQKIPYLVYKPKMYKREILEQEQDLAINITEKILIFLEQIFVFLSIFIGIRIIYFILILI